MLARNASAGKLGAMEDIPAFNVRAPNLQENVTTINIGREPFLLESKLARPKFQGWWDK